MALTTTPPCSPRVRSTLSRDKSLLAQLVEVALRPLQGGDPHMAHLARVRVPPTLGDVRAGEHGRRQQPHGEGGIHRCPLTRLTS